MQSNLNGLAGALLRAAPDAIIAVDRLGDIRFANLQAGRLLGCDPERLLGRSVESIIPGQSREGSGDGPLSYFASGGRPMGSGMRFAVQRDDGSTFPAEISLGPVVTDAGVLVVGIIRDVGAHVAVEIEQERLRVATERQWLESRARLDQRLTLLGELASGVAHDFTNWLGVILSYADLIGKRLAVAAASEPASQWEPVRKDVTQIQHAAGAAARLARQLLAFHLQEVATLDAVDLNQVIRDLEPLLQRSLGDQISLTTSLEPELRLVRANAGQIEQVLVNLTVNARDAMPNGGTLTIRTENLTRDADSSTAHPGLEQVSYVVMRVTDDGIGMTDEVRERAFEPFFTTKPHGRGSGLGLASVASIVAGWRGQARIDSEPGRGTSCSALIPAATQPAE